MRKAIGIAAACTKDQSGGNRGDDAAVGHRERAEGADGDAHDAVAGGEVVDLRADLDHDARSLAADLRLAGVDAEGDQHVAEVEPAARIAIRTSLGRERLEHLGGGHEREALQGAALGRIEEPGPGGGHERVLRGRGRRRPAARARCPSRSASWGSSVLERQGGGQGGVRRPRCHRCRSGQSGPGARPGPARSRPQTAAPARSGSSLGDAATAPLVSSARRGLLQGLAGKPILDQRRARLELPRELTRPGCRRARARARRARRPRPRRGPLQIPRPRAATSPGTAGLPAGTPRPEPRRRPAGRAHRADSADRSALLVGRAEPRSPPRRGARPLPAAVWTPHRSRATSLPGEGKLRLDPLLSRVEGEDEAVQSGVEQGRVQSVARRFALLRLGQRYLDADRPRPTATPRSAPGTRGHSRSRPRPAGRRRHRRRAARPPPGARVRATSAAAGSLR